MASDTDEEPSRRRKQSVKDYASKVFKESSVSAVSAIVSTGNIWRKIFRVLVFLLFTGGFLYQCIQFLCYVLQYPTIVNIEMERPDKYLAPAYTFCNFNPVIRSKFCSKFPDMCYEPDEEFCEMYPKYCVENNTKVPKDDVTKYLEDPKDVMELVHNWEDLLKYFRVDFTDTPEGPYPRIDWDGYGMAACYSVFSRIDSPLDPNYRTRGKWGSSWDRMSFDPKESDVLYPKSKAGILLSIHSPFEAVNPFEKGIFLKPGHLYKISVEMTEEELLEYPYKTDCLNYTKLWLSANKTGPRSQEMCRHQCFLKFTENCFNCTEPFILYPSSVNNFCQFADLPPNSTVEICNDWEEYIYPCFNKCKEDCTRMKYFHQVQESFTKRYERHNETSSLSSRIEVRVHFEETEIMKIQYKAQYQQVEAFSYIGGFIGIWLGVSLVQVVDVIESFFLITRYFLKKGTIACSIKPKLEIQSGTA